MRAFRPFGKVVRPGKARKSTTPWWLFSNHLHPRYTGCAGGGDPRGRMARVHPHPKHPMRQARTQDDMDAAFREEVALVYKHSNRCPVSLVAHQEVRRFAEEHPEVAVYVVDVNVQRPLARAVAERTGIPHHSPQAILLRGGEPAWDASHLGITAEALEGELGGGDR